MTKTGFNEKSFKAGYLFGRKKPMELLRRVSKYFNNYPDPLLDEINEFLKKQNNIHNI